jgi:hypothetical protein
MVYTIWYIPIAAWYIPSKSGIFHEATFQMRTVGNSRSGRPRPGGRQSLEGGADAAPSGHVAGTTPLHGPSHWRQRLMVTVTVGAQAFACETL